MNNKIDRSLEMDIRKTTVAPNQIFLSVVLEDIRSSGISGLFLFLCPCTMSHALITCGKQQADQSQQFTANSDHA